MGIGYGAGVAQPPRTLPLFPLSNVVLFPQLRVPLHLFEPRYRQLGRDALAGDGLIGMAVVRPEYAADMAGDPPLFPVGCAGRITRSKQLPDGRYDILLTAVGRFRILDEVEREAGRLYRVARVAMLEDPMEPADRLRVAALRSRCAELVRDLIRRTAPDRVEDLPESFLGDLDDAAFVNALCNSLAFEPAEKQGLLEADSIPARFERLMQLLSFRIAELGSAGGSLSGSFH